MCLYVRNFVWFTVTKCCVILTVLTLCLRGVWRESPGKKRIVTEIAKDLMINHASLKVVSASNWYRYFSQYKQCVFVENRIWSLNDQTCWLCPWTLTLEFVWHVSSHCSFHPERFELSEGFYGGITMGHHLVRHGRLQGIPKLNIACCKWKKKQNVIGVKLRG